MFLRQVINEDLGCASYLVACGGEAAVIDPQYDIEPYLELAQLHGLRITRVLETHDHADHVSGHGRLVEATGAEVYAPRGSGATYPHQVVGDGDVVAFGNVRIHVLATPGHRPEHVAYGIEDLSRGPGIAAVASGDSLLVGDVARPDLAVDPHEGGPHLHASIARLVELGDDVEVLPGHIGGSLCGSDRLSGRTTSTIGYERAHDSLLAEADPVVFTELLLDGLKPRPPHVEHVVGRNRGAFMTTWVDPAPLGVEDVEEAIASGAVVIDVRDGAAFRLGHVPGSASVPAREPGVGTRAATQVAPEQSYVLVADTREQARRVVPRLHAVGLDGALGYLEGGIEAWRAARKPTRGLASMPVQEFAQLLQSPSGSGVVIVDVRDPFEWRSGVAPGSRLISLGMLAAGAFQPAELAGQRVAVICLSGARAGQAAALLGRAGITDVLHVTHGGVPDLQRAGIQLAAPDPAPQLA